MKTFLFVTVVFICQTTEANPFAQKKLLNLENHEQLRQAQDPEISPLESIAHVATFEEVPIFGGEQLRQEMLQKGRLDESNWLEKTTRMIGSQLNAFTNAASTFMKGNQN